MQEPLSVGHSPAIAGRSMPGIMRRLNFAIAISAPVLPADTATSASPFFTASMASHIDDFQRPLRSAWLGLSSMRTATSVCTSRQAALSCGWAASSGSILRLVAEQDEARVRMLLQRQRRRPGRPPRGRGRPPWRRARCGSSEAWIDLNAGGGTPGNPLWSDRVNVDNSLTAGGRTSGTTWGNFGCSAEFRRAVRLQGSLQCRPS